MRFFNIFQILVLAALSVPTLAQNVYKCTDKNGAKIFTDSPCLTHQTSELITLEPNVVDGSGLRDNVRRQQRIRAKEERERLARAIEEQERLEQQREAEARRAAIAAFEGRQYYPGNQADWYSAGADFRTGYRHPIGRSNTPSHTAGCGANGCIDTHGNFYIGTGGPTIIRQDGKACTKAGPVVVCP